MAVFRVLGSIKILLRRRFFFYFHGRLHFKGGPKVLKVQFPSAPFCQKVQIPLVEKVKTLGLSLFCVYFVFLQTFGPNFFLQKSFHFFGPRGSEIFGKMVPRGTELLALLDPLETQTAMKIIKKVTPK